jgi:chromate transport protein ChrA
VPRKKLFKKMGIKNDHFMVITIETIVTIVIVMIAWIFFRSNNIKQAFEYIAKLFSPSLLSFPQIFPTKLIILTALFVLAEWLQRSKEHALQIENIRYRLIRWGIYYAVILLIFMTLDDSKQSFIYSQF